MRIEDYFIKVRDKIEEGEFDLVVYNNEPESDKLSVHIETLNYILYEWNEDHKDERNIFDYVLKPKDCDYDFTKVKMDDFFNFITKQKDKENVIIDLTTKKINKKSKTKASDIVVNSSSLPKEKPTKENVENVEKIVNSSSLPKEKPTKEKLKKVDKKVVKKPVEKKEEKKETKKLEKFEFESINPNPSLGSHTNDDEWDF